MTDDPKVRRIGTVLGVAALVIGNYLYRRYLEHAPLHLWSFVDTYYPGVVERLARTAPWRLFVPIREMSGSWTTTTLILTHFAERATSPATAWYLFNAVLIVASFVLSWWVCRSRVFGFTLALLMGFGTQLYHTYAVSGTIGLPLLFVYYELVLAFAASLLCGQRRVGLVIGFAVALILTALSYEGWLDFLVFALLASLYLAFILWRASRWSDLRALSIMAGAMTVVGLVYVYVKVHYGYAQVSGSESDVVFNYPMWSPAIEDVISNELTHLYIALTAFLPPVFLSSTALYSLGGDGVVELQRGYHAPFSYLVPMHYLFFWRYLAGAAFVVFVYALVKVIRHSSRTLSRDSIAISIFMIMIATGGPTHTFIKFRPMNSAPIVTYHAMVGVLGAALLISYLVMMAWRDVRNRRAAAALVMASWAAVMYGSLTRPARLSHLAAQVGLGEGLYPDPLRAAELDLGMQITRPAGDALYVLERAPESGYGSQRVEPRPLQWFGELRNPLPQPGEWQVTAGGISRVAERVWRVHGDGTQGRPQLVSPPLGLPPNSHATLRIDVVREQGRVCVGVIDRAADKWVVVPAILAQVYEFDTGTAIDSRVAIGNCDRRPTENPDAVFRISGGSYESVPRPGSER